MGGGEENVLKAIIDRGVNTSEGTLRRKDMLGGGSIIEKKN